jgi:ElaB/YqjD/DUF883 family membrane-anchored ribosome-binding protein
MTIETIKASAPAQALANATNHAKAMAGDALQTVSQAIDKGRASAAAQLDAGREAVVVYVREKPLTTLGIAALVGVVVGLLLFRRQN